MQNSKPSNCDNIPAHVLNRPTLPPPPKESVKPVYQPLSAEEGTVQRHHPSLALLTTFSNLFNLKFANVFLFFSACTGKRKSRLQSDMVEFFKENLAAFLINKTSNNPNRYCTESILERTYFSIHGRDEGEKKRSKLLIYHRFVFFFVCV